MNITRFSIGPIKRFNGGNPIPILGTNLLTLHDQYWNRVEYIDLGDDDWKKREDFIPEDMSWVDELANRIKERLKK